MMKIPLRYRFTKKISFSLSKIEANKEVINSIQIPIEIEENIRRQSTLGSALFSARIEGNSLTSGEVSSFTDLSAKDKRKLEVANLNRAINYILENFDDSHKFSKRDILNLHRQAMKNILADKYSGKFRAGHEGIFDSLGNIISHSPPPSQVESLMTELLSYINSRKEKCRPIKAILSHLGLEYIHPFVDGSGRVGRLLQLAVLCAGGYGMKGLVATEELIDANRQLYYRAIEISFENRDATEFLQLMLDFLEDASAKAKKNLLEKQKHNSELDALPPRRREIVEIIREQRIVSLDFLHRRFIRISPRLLSYDLMCLAREGYVQKIGKTRGALYSAK